MRIGIIGDTHDQIPELKKTIQLLNEQEIELLIHAGDWVSAFTLEYYKAFDCPIRGVWGNNVGDPRFKALAMKHGIDLEIQERLHLEIDGRSILVSHELKDIESTRGVDLVVYGHDHQAKVEEKNQMLYVNPGTLLHETYPWLKTTPSFCIYDTRKNVAEVMTLV